MNADRSVPSSVVPAVDPSRSIPQLNAATRLALALAHARMTKRRKPAMTADFTERMDLLRARHVADGLLIDADYTAKAVARLTTSGWHPGMEL